MAEHVGTLASATADFSAAISASYFISFPGIFNMSLWESEADATNFYGLNGTYIAFDNGDSTSFTVGAGFATLTVASTTGILVGMWAAIDDVTAGTNETGYYEIVSIDSGTTFTIIASTDLSGTTVLDTSDTCSYYVGGIADAFDDSTVLQLLIDTVGFVSGADPSNAINNLDILCHASSADTLIAQVDVDNISGSTSTVVNMRSLDSAFDVVNQLTIDTAGSIGALLSIGATQVNVQFYNFTLDASNATANALSLLDSTAVAGFTIWVDCVFAQATGDNISNDAGGASAGRQPLALLNCTIRDGGGHGIDGVGNDNVVRIEGGTIHTNIGGGVRLSGIGSVISGAQIYNNGDAITLDAGSEGTFIENCTIDDNADAVVWDGIGGSTDKIRITNCSITNNSGADFAPTGSDYADVFVANCLINGNGSTYTPVIGIMTQINMQTGVPGYVNQGARDYTTTSSSNLIGNGVGGDTIGALCAAAGGGGVMPLSGLIG